ncbi:transposase [Pelobium manganitolerans]|uniref:transposase n=1 Tax=Pelobium manganitolerans TaxID=1842495 RepID=UPI003FA3AF76
MILPNGDTLKQLLARSGYLLFKHHIKWTGSQKLRGELLFERYPLLNKACNLSLKLGNIFKICKSKEHAFKHLALWYNDVETCGIESFKTVSRPVQANYLSILNSSSTANKRFSGIFQC